MAEYLATINLSAAPQVDLPAQDSAAPEPAAPPASLLPNMICREKTIEPHDVIVDADGMVWYSSFGEPNLGRLDPRSGQCHRISAAGTQAGVPDRIARLAQDRDGNLWLGMMYQGGIAKFDHTTEKFRIWQFAGRRQISTPPK